MRLPRGALLLLPPAGRPPPPLPRRRSFRRHASSTTTTFAPSAPPLAAEATAAAPPIESIGILGGGISGLATAFFALALHEARHGGRVPPPRITVYEAGGRVGGWVDTVVVDRRGGGVGGAEDGVPAAARGQVRFETGPHTLRIGGSFESRVTVALLRMLGLDTRWETHTRGAAASRNRYLYTGARALYRLPSSLGDVFRDIQTRGSLMRDLPGHMVRTRLGVWWRPPWRSRAPPADQSVGEVMAFWSGRAWVEQVASAFVRGVTAGDPFKLSMRAFNEKAYLWHCEMLGAKKGALGETVSPFEGEDQLRFKQWSDSVGIKDDSGFEEGTVMYLKGGLGAIPGALEALLKFSGNVDIVKQTKVTNLSMADDGKRVLVHTSSSSTPKAHSLVISALPPSALTPISPALATIPSLDVGVVNLYYSDASLLRYNGFGYLVPRVLAHHLSADGLPTKSRGDVLGVLFDSKVAPGLDGAGGTKLTVLLGGAIWAGRRADEIPDERALVRAAREGVREQLGIGAEPVAVSARLLKECIPQLPVGHGELVREAVEELDDEFGGRVSLTGTAVHWPSVPRCFAGAWRQACWVARQVDKSIAQGVSR